MDMKRQAKMDVLKHIRKIASDAMKDDIKGVGLKKVSVAADSTKGLEEGLDKAKELLANPEEMMDHEGHMGHMGGMDEEMGESEDESYEEEASEEESSPESIDAQIKALEEKKAKLMKK